MNFEDTGHADQRGRRADQRNLGARRHCRAYGADPEGTGRGQADLGGQTQRAMPQCAYGVIDFVDHLQHPLHAPTLGEPARSRREWGHTLAMVPGAA